MFGAEFDSRNNLLTVSLIGEFNKTDADGLQERLLGIVPTLTKGFRLLTDMSALERMDPELFTYVERAMDLLDKHGVSEIIRIVPDPARDIGFNIMSLFHYSPNVRIRTISSLSELCD